MCQNYKELHYLFITYIRHFISCIAVIIIHLCIYAIFCKRINPLINAFKREKLRLYVYFNCIFTFCIVLFSLHICYIKLWENISRKKHSVGNESLQTNRYIYLLSCSPVALRIIYIYTPHNFIIQISMYFLKYYFQYVYCILKKSKMIIMRIKMKAEIINIEKTIVCSYEG